MVSVTHNGLRPRLVRSLNDLEALKLGMPEANSFCPPFGGEGGTLPIWSRLRNPRVCATWLSMFRKGYHIAAWRHAVVQADGSMDFHLFLNVTTAAARGKFDVVFMADEPVDLASR
jgi:hypothetical protein